MSHPSPVVCFFIFCKLFPFEKFHLLHSQINTPADVQSWGERPREREPGCPEVGKMTTTGIRVSSLTPRAHFASGLPQAFPHRYAHGFWITGLLLRSHQGSVALATSQPRPEVRDKGITAARLTRFPSPKTVSDSSAPSGMGLLTTCLGNPSPLLSSLFLESTCS